MAKAIWGLEKFNLFKEITATDIQSITQIANKRTYEKGDIITDPNSKSRDLFLLIDGKVDIISPRGI